MILHRSTWPRLRVHDKKIKESFDILLGTFFLKGRLGCGWLLILHTINVVVLTGKDRNRFKAENKSRTSTLPSWMTGGYRHLL